MTEPLPDDALRQRRKALLTLFATHGVALATWAVHLPAMQERTGISTAMLGTIVLILGLGALASVRPVGPLIARFGSWRIAALSTLGMSLMVSIPLAAVSTVQCAFGAFALGLMVGASDVSMNAASVEIEREYGRPILASFHGVYSLGNVLGSLGAAALLGLGTNDIVSAALVAATCTMVAAWAGIHLSRMNDRRIKLSGHPLGGATSDAQVDSTQNRTARTRRVLVFGSLAFALFLAEGSAMDWSSLHAQRHLGVSQSIGALVYAAFVSAMTLGRFCVDRISARHGPVSVLRWGSVIAATGLLIVVVSPAVWLTAIGWFAFGIGLSGGVPQVFSAAGNQTGAPGGTLSPVVGFGYFAVLAGPGLIGWIAEIVSLNAALLLPLAGVLACALAARQVAARRND